MGARLRSDNLHLFATSTDNINSSTSQLLAVVSQLGETVGSLHRELLTVRLQLGEIQAGVPTSAPSSGSAHSGAKAQQPKHLNFLEQILKKKKK